MNVLTVVSLPNVNGLPEDDVQNSFAIEASIGWDPLTELGQITIPIAGFYNYEGAGGPATALSKYLSRTLSRAALACRIQVYDITGNEDGSPHGSPIAEDLFTLGAGLGTEKNMPSEVSSVLTMRALNWATQPVETPDNADADFVVQRELQRYTGRIYAGPFSELASDAVGTAESRPNAGLRATLTNAANYLRDQLIANNHELCVWSRKDAVLRPVTDVFCDDAWDTQRRRGVAPTARTSLTIA